MVVIISRHRLCLNEYLAPHKPLESSLVEDGFDRRDLFLVDAEEVYLQELFCFLIAIPKLKVVNDGEVVGLHSIGRNEPVSLESLQLSRGADGKFPIGAANCMFRKLCINLHFRFNAEQY